MGLYKDIAIAKRAKLTGAAEAEPRLSRAGRRRVVITGIGVVTPLGNTLEELWRNLLAGESGVRPLTRFPPERFACRLAAQVEDFELPELPGAYRHEIKRMDPFVQYALAATKSALEAAGFPLEKLADSTDGGLFLGVAMGGLGTIESGVLLQEAKGPRKTNPYLIPSLIPNMAAGMIGLTYGYNGPQYTIVGGCSSSIQAIGQAMEKIRDGRATWALTGGSEAVITPITFSGFQAMGALSPAVEPAPTPRPFDRNRDGMIVGEAAGMILLEEREAALKRGAPILAELSGYATSTVTSVAFFQCGDETARCMELTLTDAGLDAAEVDSVYAHAGGLAGDASEMKALLRVFAERGARPAITSIKGHLGYSFAGAGPLDIAAAVMALREQRLSPTLNYSEPEPEFAALDIVAHPREARLRTSLVNSFGLGGVNACVLLTESVS